MPEEARKGAIRAAMEEGILGQIREEMQRAYHPREGKPPVERAEAAVPPSSGELAELRAAIAALSSSYALVGQTPPEPPTFRGRIGARLVRLVQRLLFWYTPQIVHFQYSALRTFESALRALEGQARNAQERETESMLHLEAGLHQSQQHVETGLRQAQKDLVAGLQQAQRNLETGLGQMQQTVEAGLEHVQESGMEQIHRLETAVAATTSHLEIMERRLEGFQHQAIPRMDREVARLGAQYSAQEERIQREVSRLRAQQAVREERVARLIQTRIDLPEGAGLITGPLPPQAGARSEESHNMDALYAALEDEFRGSRDGIKELLTGYLPRLTGAGIGSEAMPILDVGCGRGEWLELLREHGLHAAGVDLNRVVLAICREHGLAVMEADAIEHLRSLPEASLGAVTAFHVIEHLELQALLDFLDAIRRVLKPGGVAIFETPNPNNVFVSSRYFYLDPTHRHPIPPLLGRFLVEARGFERVEVEELHPWPVEHRVGVSTGGEVAARFNECFYGPQDYAIIGWKS